MFSVSVQPGVQVGGDETVSEASQDRGPQQADDYIPNVGIFPG